MTDVPIIIHFNASAFIKVQNVRSPPSSTSQIPNKKGGLTTAVIGSIIGSVLVLFVVVGFILYILHKRRRNAKMEEEYIKEVPGMTTWFS